MADVAFGRCIKCRHVVALPADACPRCGKALEVVAPPPKTAPPPPSGAPVPPPPAPAPSASPLSSPSRRTLLLAGLAIVAVLALIVAASLLSKDKEDPAEEVPGVARFFLQTWDAPSEVRAGASFKVVLTIDELARQPDTRQTVSIEIGGAEWGRQTLTPGSGGTREVVIFARVDAPGTYQASVRFDDAVAASRQIVVLPRS